MEANLAFPCEASTLYGHWNPYDVNPKSSPPPKQGTTDQYEMGDLSGKFGRLNGLTQYEDAYNDTNLPLFGYNSIIGRSVVIHKQQRDARWACRCVSIVFRFDGHIELSSRLPQYARTWL